MSEDRSDVDVSPDLSQTTVRELTDFQRNVLVVLAGGSAYGLAIKRELASHYGSAVNHGRLYPNLDELVDLGLIHKGKIDDRTNEYSLTEDGYAALLDQLDWTLSKVCTDPDRADAVKDLVDEVT